MFWFRLEQWNKMVDECVVFPFFFRSKLYGYKACIIHCFGLDDWYPKVGCSMCIGSMEYSDHLLQFDLINLNSITLHLQANPVHNHPLKDEIFKNIS
ncbi:hypothetical protein QVD17_22616 [Tagetes erecta]|uniref:Uncharacterized protein n=1 Tax=Tagetes erecta TaxID=13708 RepID=A0AAD8KD59_TARER|nr:hypothetical protein QVD17_22616 [Tagetes erecta]